MKKYTWVAVIGGILAILATVQALGMVPWVTPAEVETKYETREHSQEMFQLIREDLRYIKNRLDEGR